MADKMHIRCPLCGWHPGPEARWSCEPGCGTVWNTFWTRGLCPGCSKQWTETQCPSCHGLSPHRKWYRSPAGIKPATRREKTPASS